MVQGRTGTGGVVPLMVRVPEDLRDRIKAAADANGRSQNSEIVATLEEKYPAPTDFDFGSFLTIWSRRLLQTDDPVELKRLANIANQELSAVTSEWRLESNGMLVQIRPAILDE